MCKIAVIPVASGSTGNCIYLEIGPYHLLIDMGAGYRKVRDALSKNGRDIEKIDAVFLTHGHNDHIKGALPETADIALVGGLAGEVSLTKSTVKYGDSIGL